MMRATLTSFEEVKSWSPMGFWGLECPQATVWVTVSAMEAFKICVLLGASGPLRQNLQKKDVIIRGWS
jgi:hypothetical protein